MFGIQNRAVPSTFTIYPLHFSIAKISETLKGSPAKIFGTVTRKTFDGNFRYSPLFSINLFATGNFLKHIREGFTQKLFRHCETKNFLKKLLIPPPPVLSILFRYRNFSETQHTRAPLPNISAL